MEVQEKRISSSIYQRLRVWIMEMGAVGGLAGATLVKSQNMPEIIKIFREIIIKSAGEKC